MAQLLLTAATAIGGAASSAGIGGFLVSTVASTAAAAASGYVDRLVFGPRRRAIEGPRLDGFQVQASQEGASILRVFGRARVSGQLIWAANFRETVSETTEASGGKGPRPSVETTITEFLYSISFAVGLCEGEIDGIGRVWADGKPFDLSEHNVRIYRGSEDQLPDGVIEAVEGAGNAPAFRGLAYIVFEDLPLRDFGNRIPQLSFEIENALRSDDGVGLEENFTAASIIPGSGEFVYGTTPVRRIVEEGVTVSENNHSLRGETDFLASVDGLTQAAPNFQHASLIVSWFGDTLDAGAITLQPGVENREKVTEPYEWTAGGATRADAHLISTIDDGAAYGGTPSDRSVIEAIEAFHARGIEVMFHPFILMDTSGFPWRGRISVGANDKTAVATNDIAHFFGTASPGDFSINNGSVIYAGPSEWSFRRMILHYAHLCVAAGGVDAFLLGSELRAITWARDENGNYPAVDAIRALADDVRNVVGSDCEISYAADWSEYFGHQPGDGSGDVFFHLDDLWSDQNIDFIGIDNYMPLADWRDGFAHLDAQTGAGSQYDREYLQSNIRSGEGYDWFYANQDDRDDQIRTPITDGAFNEPWIFRYKDLWNWWSNPHHHRPGGVRNFAPTSWVPQSKRFVFTEIGCPAVDKGANQPNVFIDPKSIESALPHYSNGGRDDFAQRRFIEAHGAYWRDMANNPVSSITNAPMVDATRQYVYAWDARPFPEFPSRADIWGDAANWTLGHWINGRLARAPLDLLVTALSGEVGFTDVDATRLDGSIAGYVIDRPMSAREMIDPLADIFQFDMIETGDRLRFQPRFAPPSAVVSNGNFVIRDEGAISHSFAQEFDTPAAFRLGFLDESDDYAPAVAEARDPGARALREVGAEAPVIMSAGDAQTRARSILADAWVMREQLQFTLPPSMLAIEPGDLVVAEDIDPTRLFRLTQIEDTNVRAGEAVRVAPAVLSGAPAPIAFTPTASAPDFSAPIWELMDLPLLSARVEATDPYFAAFSHPWPGGAALYRSAGAGAPILSGGVGAPAVMGRLVTALGAAPSGRWWNGHVEISIGGGILSAREEIDVLSGANLCGVRSANGDWEVIQFQHAELLSNGRWRLSRMLRGQAGSEAEALAGATPGARFVLLNGAVTQIPFSLSLRGLDVEWRAGPDEVLPGDARFTAQTINSSVRGLIPLSPVRLRAQRLGEDIALSWIRRTRLGGDTWEDEPLLSESVEQYRIEIISDGDVLREATSLSPSYLYLAADIAADFGSNGPESTITFSVAQISEAVGAGVAAQRTAII